MKKIMITALLTVSSFTVLPTIAAPVVSQDIRFECPNASGGSPSERLTNYGTYITGMGQETIGKGPKSLPMFHGIATGGVPLNLAFGGYVHAGAIYNEHTGRITCLFTSTIGADSFNVSYVADNIKHGAVVKLNDHAVTVRIYQG